MAWVAGYKCTECDVFTPFPEVWYDKDGIVVEHAEGCKQAEGGPIRLYNAQAINPRYKFNGNGDING